jgi:hypothetical protein
VKGKGKCRSRSLQDDSQKNKGNGKGISRFPEGMTERKARANEEAAEIKGGGGR